MRAPSGAEILLAMILLFVPVVAFSAAVIMQWLRTKERLRAIEKGVAPEPVPRGPSTIEQVANFRAAGLICIAVGVGLVILFSALALTIREFSPGIIGVAAVPLCVGIALLVEFAARRRDAESQLQ